MPGEHKQQVKQRIKLQDNQTHFSVTRIRMRLANSLMPYTQPLLRLIMLTLLQAHLEIAMKRTCLGEAGGERIFLRRKLQT